MVPVLDSNKKPLMPCSEKRAKLLMQRGQAHDYWQNGIFCIKLTREPSDRQHQPVALGVDPGSKREGYSVLTEKHTVLNITTNTPDWVKAHVETRRMLRRNRRYRKTPYRACRNNRAVKRQAGFMPPSTRARWGAKLRIIKQLLKILPLTIVNVEDIKATTKEGKKKWNISFSPLEVGKKWFYSEVKSLGVKLILTEGYRTYTYRFWRGFYKSASKLDYTWSAHNSDSHILAEIALDGTEVKPIMSMYKIEFNKLYRRRLHAQVPAKRGYRKPYGSTVSLGMSRGSIIKWKNKMAFLGGTSKGKVSVCSIITGKRKSRAAKKEDIQVLHITKQRVQFLPSLKQWVSLHNHS